MDRPRGSAMDRPRRGAAAGPSPGRQPTLAEEIEEVEREQRVTKTLQAQVEPPVGTEQGRAQHGFEGQEPLTREVTGVSLTTKPTPKKAETPSPVRVDADGNT